MLEMFGALFLGLLLTMIGAGADVEWLYLIGVIIMPLALLWGALFKAEDDIKIKITLLAMAGLLMAAVVMSFSGMSYDLGSLF